MSTNIAANQPVILISSQMSEVYIFGHQFGEQGYIVAGSFCDAYDELLEHALSVDGPCDHGGDLTDEQVFANGGCDCDMTNDGKFVWMVDNWWLRKTDLPVSQFLLAFCVETGSETM